MLHSARLSRVDAFAMKKAKAPVLSLEKLRTLTPVETPKVKGGYGTGDVDN